MTYAAAQPTNTSYGDRRGRRSISPSDVAASITAPTPHRWGLDAQ